MYNVFVCLHFDRTADDDIIVLKKELVTIQTLMDQMSLEAEAEKIELAKECEVLKTKNAEYVSLLYLHLLLGCQRPAPWVV